MIEKVHDREDDIARHITTHFVLFLSKFQLSYSRTTFDQSKVFSTIEKARNYFFENFPQPVSLSSIQINANKSQIDATYDPVQKAS